MTAGPELELGIKQLKARADWYAELAAYYRGEHRLQFATEKFRAAFGRLFQEFSDNLCPAVVDSVADRLEVLGFVPAEGAAGAEGGGEAPQVKWALNLWRQNRMDQRSGAVHQEALLSGDAYVVAWPSARTGEVRLYPQLAAQVSVGYDEEDPDQVRWAIKAWTDQDRRVRVTLYYPDRIEKYRSLQSGQEGSAMTLPERASSYEPYRPKLDDEWPVTNPYDQVPVLHFANNPGLGQFGCSELRDVIPLQDALNKSVLDMMVGMEFVALPQRWATGIEDDDDDDQGKSLQARVDHLWQVESEAAKFGQFPSADLRQFLEVQQAFKQDIARVTRLPLHILEALKGTPNSGEVVRSLEGPLVRKCRSRQGAFGATWTMVMALAGLMAGQGEVRVRPQWLDPAIKSDKEFAETTYIRRQLGVSRRQAFKELDYTEPTIQQMLKDQPQDPMEPGAGSGPAGATPAAAGGPPGTQPVARGGRGARRPVL